MKQTISRRKMLATFAGLFALFGRRSFATDKQADGVTSASAETPSNVQFGNEASKVLLVLVSFHHKNTEKIAVEMAKVLDAQIKSPEHISNEDLLKYRLIGFGSGIYDQKHHRKVLELIDRLPADFPVNTFIYSTSGISRATCVNNSIDDPHEVIRKKLQAKGCKVLDEYNCAGWNTNTFLKLIGGINRGKPNADDLNQARKFAENLRKNLS